MKTYWRNKKVNIDCFDSLTETIALVWNRHLLYPHVPAQCELRNAAHLRCSLTISFFIFNAKTEFPAQLRIPCAYYTRREGGIINTSFLIMEIDWLDNLIYVFVTVGTTLFDDLIKVYLLFIFLLFFFSTILL